MRNKLKIIGFCLLFFGFFESVQANDFAEKFYLDIYEKAKTEVDAKTIERVAKQSNLDQATVKTVLQGGVNEKFLNKCKEIFPKLTNQETYECQQYFQEAYQYENKLKSFEDKLQNRSSASEMWSDGDLSNSFFDVMADLQVIEVILFGKTDYQYLFEGETATNPNTANSGNPLQSSFIPHSKLILPAATDSLPSGSGIENVCRDPNQIFPTGNFDHTSGSFPLVGSTQGVPTSAFNSEQFGYQGRNFAFPQGGGGNTGLFDGFVPQSPWPCSGIFCVKIGTKPQTPNGTGGEAVALQEMIKKGIEQLTYLKGYSLTVRKNSNERFMIGVGKFLSRPFTLDVITQNLPVKLKPDKTAFDDDNQQPGTAGEKAGLLERYRKNLSEQTGCYPEKNGDRTCDDSKASIESAEAGDQSKPVWEKTELDSEKLKQKTTLAREAWLRSQDTKQNQSHWEEFKKQLNAMSGYFASIEEMIKKLENEGMSILEETGRSCNSIN